MAINVKKAGNPVLAPESKAAPNLTPPVSAGVPWETSADTTPGVHVPLATALGLQSESHATTHNTVATISTKHPTGADTSHEEIVKTSKMVGPVCTVEVSLGITKNLGNYSSARADVRLSVPCLHDEIDSVFEFAKSWVDERIGAIDTDFDAMSQGGK